MSFFVKITEQYGLSPKYLHPAYWIEKNVNSNYNNVYISNYKKQIYEEGYAMITHHIYFTLYYMKELNSILISMLITYTNFVNDLNDKRINKKLTNKMLKTILDSLFDDLSNKLNDYLTVYKLIETIYTMEIREGSDTGVELTEGARKKINFLTI